MGNTDCDSMLCGVFFLCEKCRKTNGSESGLNDLLPCPFCGTAVEMEETEGGDGLIRCSVCHVHMFDKMEWDGTDEAELVKAWNKRAR